MTACTAAGYIGVGMAGFFLGMIIITIALSFMKAGKD